MIRFGRIYRISYYFSEHLMAKHLLWNSLDRFRSVVV